MFTWVQKYNYVGADLKIGLIVQQAYELLLIIIANHVHSLLYPISAGNILKKCKYFIHVGLVYRFVGNRIT